MLYILYDRRRKMRRMHLLHAAVLLDRNFRVSTKFSPLEYLRGAELEYYAYPENII